MLRYRLLISLLFPVVCVALVWQALKLRQPRFFWQRMGRQLPEPGARPLWIHCASVGEVITVMPLLQRLRQQHTLPILITTNTATGARIVAQQAIDNLHHCYLPFDTPFAIRRFLRRLRPRALLVVETELWPQLFRQCRLHACPVVLINARVSIKTTQAPRWLKAIFRLALQQTDAIHARSGENHRAFVELGARAGQVSTTGNLKLARSLPATGDDVETPPRPYVLLASSHDDEERQVADQWFSLERPELLLIAPRHPERGVDIASQLQQRFPDKRIALYSRGQAITEKTDIYLLDTVGRLIHYFADAALVIMGGSFVNTGGHNILEPARFGRAILCGPFMHNFSDELKMMQEHNAIVCCPGIETLAPEMKKLLESAPYRHGFETAAREISQKANHVVEDYFDIVHALLRPAR